MKRRITALVLLSLMLLGALVGCKSSPDTTSTTPNETEVATTENTVTTPAKDHTDIYDDSDDIPSYVTACFATDTPVDLTNAERFTADNSEYEQEVVFFANSGDVYDFEFCSINWLDESDGGESDIEFVPMFTVDTLSNDTPLVVTMTFWGDIPSYGITYTDTAGVEHSGTISISGENGSVILDII